MTTGSHLALGIWMWMRLVILGAFAKTNIHSHMPNIATGLRYEYNANCDRLISDMDLELRLGLGTGTWLTHHLAPLSGVLLTYQHHVALAQQLPTVL